jgi:hypothetical protein
MHCRRLVRINDCNPEALMCRSGACCETIWRIPHNDRAASWPWRLNATPMAHVTEPMDVGYRRMFSIPGGIAIVEEDTGPSRENLSRRRHVPGTAFDKRSRTADRSAEEDGVVSAFDGCRRSHPTVTLRLEEVTGRLRSC